MSPSPTRVWFNRTFSSIQAALALIRAGDSHRAWTLVVTSTNPQAVAFLPADETALEPRGLKGEAYLAWCLDFCRTQRIDVLLPGKEAALISRHHAAFAACGVRVLSAAAPETLDLLHDKGRFYDTARAATAPSPAYQPFDSAERFEAAYAMLRSRYSVLCMKPAVSVYGIGFRVIDETRGAFDLLLGDDPYRVDLPSLRRAIQEAAPFKTLLLMPFLAGHEFSVDCVAHAGELLCAVARRKALRTGGGQRIVVRADIEQACTDLVAQFGLNGPVNIQFREGDEGLRVLEINPRMSGGIAMACLAGPNLPYLALKRFIDGPGSIDIEPIQDGLRVAEVNQAVVLPP